MKHNIGSKQAAVLAAEKFGPQTYVKRQGKVFTVGMVRMVGFFGCLHFGIDRIFGQGKSWETALISAGVFIPEEAIIPSRAQVTEALGPDADPGDTDAKEPEYGDGV